jgi:hypothetical protein
VVESNECHILSDHLAITLFGGRHRAGLPRDLLLMLTSPKSTRGPSHCIRYQYSNLICQTATYLM